MTLITNYNKTAIIDISASTTISEAIDLGGDALAGLIMPSAFTGTAITYQVSNDKEGTYVVLNDDAGNAVSTTVAPSKAITLNPTTFYGWRYIKLVSGSAEAADRTIILATRPV